MCVAERGKGVYPWSPDSPAQIEVPLVSTPANDNREHETAIGLPSG